MECNIAPDLKQESTQTAQQGHRPLHAHAHVHDRYMHDFSGTGEWVSDGLDLEWKAVQTWTERQPRPRQIYTTQAPTQARQRRWEL